MKFAAFIDYASDQEKINALQPAHREYLRGLFERGRLFAAGPFTDASGALWVYEAETPEQAESLIQSDPYHAAGLFVRWRVCPLAYWSAQACKGAS